MSSSRDGFTIGEAARLLNVKVRLVDEWVRDNRLRATCPRKGAGHPKRIAWAELELAKRVLSTTRRLGLTRIPRELFERQRTAIRRGAACE